MVREDRASWSCLQKSSIESDCWRDGKAVAGNDTHCNVQLREPSRKHNEQARTGAATEEMLDLQKSLCREEGFPLLLQGAVLGCLPDGKAEGNLIDKVRKVVDQIQDMVINCAH